MKLRLEEIHPALVHLPIAFTPVAIGADMIGRATGNRSLLSFGQNAIAVAAAGAAVSGVSGLVAGEEVNVEGRSRAMLMTHRNLNFVAALAVGALALWRARRDRPSVGYLTLGGAVTGVFAYTAYLGGKMISEYGVGVGPAGGVYRPDAPVLGAAPLGEVAREAGKDLVDGVKHMVEEVASGQIVPALAGGSKEKSETPELQSA